MELTVNIAGAKIAVTLVGQSKKALQLCNNYFGDFIRPGRGNCAEIKVSILENSNGGVPLQPTPGQVIVEQLLSTPDVAQWLQDTPEYREDFPLDETTICSFCMDGLLLFNPKTAAGHIYLLKQGPGVFRPLHRLLWMYFAQVLGEQAGCFVHAAALAWEKEGYLFLGDSGAGKSTLANDSRQGIVLSDDSPVFRKLNGKYHVFASPYHQQYQPQIRWQKAPDMCAQVKGLYFLVKDDNVFVNQISKKKAVSMIISRYILFFNYLSPQAKRLLFDLFLEACHNLPTYYLHYFRGGDVWSVIIDG